MPSPLLEANSTSLGGWTSMVNGVNVAAGEVVSLRLADTAAVKFWSLEITSTDPETGRQGTSPAVAVDPTTHTATFTMPVIPADGVALRFLSIVGVSSIGKDANFVLQDSYRFSTVVCVLAPSGLRVLTTDQTTEGSAAYGWGNEIDQLLRYPIGSTSVPSGAAGGDLGSVYPNPSVLKLHGASIPAAGSLVTGNAPYVSGASALTYSALNLAGGSGWIAGQLPLINFAPGTNGQILDTAGGVASWVTVAGDVTGAPTAFVVGKINGATVPAAGALTTGQVLRVTGVSALGYGPLDLANANAVTGILDASHIPAGASITMAGDVTGPSGTTVVVQIHGASVPIAGALTVGNLLQVTGASALGYAALNLAGGAGFVTGVLPVGNLPSLAGDTTGTLTANTVGKVKGTTVTTAGGALTTGQSLRATGVATADWGALDLANANAVTGVLPAANLPASASTGQIVATLAALALLDTATFADTTQCGVATLLDSFTLRKTDTQTPDGIKVIAAKSGGGTVGNWVRNERPHPAWLLVTDWYVTSGGNDEALGDATHQLASPEEVLRRIGPSAVLPAVTIHVQATLASTKPFDIPRSVRAPLGLTIVGTPTQVATGTLTAVGAAVPASATKYKVTASGLAGGFGPHVGRLMRNTTVGARFGTYWFIGANLGSGIAEVSSPGSSVPIGGITAQVLGAFTLLPPVNGDTFEILTLPQVTVRGIEPEGTVFSTFLDYQCNGAAPVTGYLSACKIDKAAIVGPSGNCAWSQVYYSGSTVIRFARFFFAACWGEIDGSVGSMTFTGCRANSDNDNILNGATMSLVQSEMDLTSAAVFNAPLDGFSVDSGSTLRLPSPSAIWGTGNGRVGVLVRAGSKVASNVGGLYYCNLGLGAQREVLLGDRYVLYNMLPARAINSGADWGEIRNPF